jgi:hypothetical protein
MRKTSFVLLLLLALSSPAIGQILSLPANPEFQNVYIRNATGCINWDGGDITLCKTAANALTLAGGVLSLPAGVVGAPPLNFGTATTGIYSTSASAIDLALGGVRRYSFSTSDFNFYSDAASINLGASIDARIFREAAAVFRLGDNSATPVAQTFKGSDATGGGPTAGGSLALRGGNPAGAAAYGDVIFQSSGGNIVWTPLQAAGALAGTLANSVALGDPAVYFKVKNGANFYAVPGWLIP